MPYMSQTEQAIIESAVLVLVLLSLSVLTELKSAANRSFLDALALEMYRRVASFLFDPLRDL